jgi:hypothetical protein
VPVEARLGDDHPDAFVHDRSLCSRGVARITHGCDEAATPGR